MTGFENYSHELRDLDREISHYAAVCGIDLADRGALERSLARPHDRWTADKAHQALRGLLILRLKVETEMLEIGLQPPPLHTAEGASVPTPGSLAGDGDAGGDEAGRNGAGEGGRNI